MSELSPPPWLWMQQRLGPPPSYPNLKIPGVNSPIPPHCQLGYFAEGWGRYPVDEQERPLYGDVFGTYVEETEKAKIDPESVKLWGELPPVNYEEEERKEREREAEEKEGEMEMDEGEEKEGKRGEEEERRMVIPGSEVPMEIPLRKEVGGGEKGAEEKTLFTPLEEVEVSGGTGLMPVTKKYVIPGKNA